MFSAFLFAAFLPAAWGANFWFSFGDSYTSTGFIPYVFLPSTENPIGNPPYPGLTTTPGPNWIDFETTTYNKSQIFTYNLAFSGATIDSSLVAPFIFLVSSLKDQVSVFTSQYSTKPASTPWTSDNALFSIWIGINDIGNSYSLGGDRLAFNDVLLDAEFTAVQELVYSGARNFLFINVPPMNRSPLFLSRPAADQALEKSIVEDFNSKLFTKIASFKATNSDATTFMWDSYAAFTPILDNPTAYGFNDATSYGQSGDFWGNNYHPSSDAHKIFARQIGQTTLAGTIW